jgi:hypothetical protein
LVACLLGRPGVGIGHFAEMGRAEDVDAQTALSP